VRVGLDFDNTIVRYDDVFHRAALERALIPPELPVSKIRVRDHLRSAGLEVTWIELQGYVYGKRMDEALPYSGVLEFLAACREARVPVAIVSHRTRFPNLGEQHDLHVSAREWLARRGFHDPSGIGLPEACVFFEETREAKLARIAELGCTHFIDDLPELLAHPLFPAGVQRVLFDPHAVAPLPAETSRLTAWDQAAAVLGLKHGP
jgi:hypothetical protein